MPGHYFRVALRNLLRFRTYTLINIGGLSVGLACCLLILLHLYSELSFDRFHENADRIFRVNQVQKNDGSERHLGWTMLPLGETLRENFPEAEASATLMRGWRLTVKHPGSGPAGHIVRDYFFANRDFLSVFDFETPSGSEKLYKALAEPGSVVLTRTLAAKLFGDADPLNRTLEIEAEDFPEFGENRFTVTGVIADIPANSHLDFELLISTATLERFRAEQEWLFSWKTFLSATYVLLSDPSAAPALEAKFPAFSRQHRDEKSAARYDFYLQPLTDIHFGSGHVSAELNVREGNMLYVYVFGLIAFFIALIACINYINLATARSAKRAREIGLRKVIGARPRQMIIQFLGESVFSALLALLMALVMLELLLPVLNAHIGTHLNLNMALDSVLLPVFPGLTILVGLLAGIYPAVYLAGLKPVLSLKGEFRTGRKQAHVRRSLVAVQFALSILLIAVTLAVFQQISFMRHKSPGFNPQGLLVFDINHDDVQANFLTVKNELLGSAAVQNVTVSSRVPGDWKGYRRVNVHRDGRPAEDALRMNFNGVDEDFFSTYEIDIVQGRSFRRDLAGDSTALIINETAAGQLFAGKSPLGQTLHVPSADFSGQVIGITRDFHYHSLHTPIQPLLIGFMPPGGRHAVHGIDYFTLRIAPGSEQAALAFVEHIHQQFDPVNPIESAFLSTWWTELYEHDERMGRLFGAAAGMAILIACAGLFGLAAFMTEQRTKEIGVRKVLGASTHNVVLILLKEYVGLVAVGFLAGAPPAYFAIRTWLQDFAYRADIAWWIFGAAGGLALTIAVLTVSYQAVRAAVANPVDSLRHE